MTLLFLKSKIYNKLYYHNFFKKGYIGVICREKEENEMKMTISEKIKEEREFFKSHKLFWKIADKMGIPYLLKTLNAYMIGKIKKIIPKIQKNLSKLIEANFIFLQVNFNL